MVGVQTHREAARFNPPSLLQLRVDLDFKNTSRTLEHSR